VASATRKDALVPAPHPLEFRQRAVELARQGEQPIAEVDDKGSETRLTSAEKKELAELRRDKRRLEVENEILKRAAAYFARENVLWGSNIGLWT
jgi:transposase-like protein